MTIDKITSFENNLDVPVLNKVLDELDSGKLTYKYFDTVPTAADLNKGMIGIYSDGAAVFRIYWKTHLDELKYVNGL